MGLFNQEQIEGFIKQIKEIITNAEMVLENNPNIENAEDLKSLIKSQKKSLEKYEDDLEIMNEVNEVGRPAIGITKKVSLTLSESDWEWLDEKAEGNRSRLLRKMIKKEMGK